jgi:mitochondrial ornithine carrier protein
MAGKVIEYPFDTVKVRLQSQPDNRPLRYKGPLDCFQQSIRQDGFRGLYRGISAPLVGAALEISSLFVWEQAAQKAIISTGLYPRDSPLPLSALYLTGSIAGAFTSLVLTPIELIKCKMQVPAMSSSDGIIRTAQSPFSIIRQVFRYHGILGFWNGQLGTLIRETGGCAAWFGSKETVTMLFRRFNDTGVTIRADVDDGPIRMAPLPIWQQAIAGAAAGVSYNFLFFPADTIKSRMQTASVDHTSTRTFWKEGATLWKEHGTKGLYRGCGITLLRSAPSSAFIFMVYDFLKRNCHLS